MNLPTWLPTWYAQAACLGHPNPELWFPASRNATGTRAKTICTTCPALTPCLNDALNDRTRKGIWGATTEADRAQLRRNTTPKDQAS